MSKIHIKIVQSEYKWYSLFKYRSHNTRKKVRNKEKEKKELAKDPNGLYHTLNKVTSCLLVRRVTDTTLFTSPRNTTPVCLTTCPVCSFI